VSDELRELIGSPIEVGGRVVGRVADIILTPDSALALGCEVVRLDGSRAFLPWAATRRDDGALGVESTPALLGELELRHYLAVGIRLSRLGSPEDAPASRGRSTSQPRH